MCWHTANDAVGRQIDAAWWIICLYGGNIVLILMVYSTFARSREVQKGQVSLISINFASKKAEERVF